MDIIKESHIQKKIEKISQALYLVTNHLKDSEPLKWELRRESITLLASVRSLGDMTQPQAVPPDLAIDGLFASAQDIIAHLSLAIIAGLISHTNGELIIREINNLLSTFEHVVDETTAKAGFVLSREFFATDSDLAQQISDKISKGQNIGFLSKGQKPAQSGKSMSEGEIALKDKKDSRQNRIVSMLKQQGKLTIKDFVKVIHGCSEKTIQRELTDLVKKGIVKKEGERRWSTYSLK